jgi:DNA-damage-inducible protein J
MSQLRYKVPDMNAHTSMLHVRLDSDLKAQGIEALEAFGLSASDAVRILFKRIVAEQGFPLELKVPNAETLAALEEAQKIMVERRAQLTDLDVAFNELDGTDERPRG